MPRLCDCLAVTLSVGMGLGVELVPVVGAILGVVLNVRHAGLVADWNRVADAFVTNADKILTMHRVLVYTGLVLAVVIPCQSVLLAYECVLLLLAIYFVTLAIIAFRLHHNANKWKSKKYPALHKEVEVGDAFNEGFCYAQGDSMCQSGSASELAQYFLINSSTSSMVGVDGSASSVCNESFIAAVPSIKPLCDGCAVVHGSKKHDSIVDWAQHACPHDDQVSHWCGNYIAQDLTMNATLPSPYSACRDSMLHAVADAAIPIGWGCIFMTCALLASLMSAQNKRVQDLSDDEVDDVSIGCLSTSHLRTLARERARQAPRKESCTWIA